MNKRLYRHKLSSNGFTLLEVMIAVSILSIGILSLAGMQISAIRGNSSANSITEAANETRNLIEELISKDFDNSDFDVGDHSININDHTAVKKIQWTVSEWLDDGIDNDGDGEVDEFDERGIKSIEMAIQYSNNGTLKESTIHFLKSKIF